MFKYSTLTYGAHKTASCSAKNTKTEMSCMEGDEHLKCSNENQGIWLSILMRCGNVSEYTE